MASIAGIFDLCQCRSSCLFSLATRVAASSNKRQVEPAPEQTNMNTRVHTSGETALSHFRKTQTAIVLGEFFQELFIDIAQKEISSAASDSHMEIPKSFRRIFLALNSAICWLAHVCGPYLTIRHQAFSKRLFSCCIEFEVCGIWALACSAVVPRNTRRIRNIF